MWDGVLRVFRDTLEKGESMYLVKAKSGFYLFLRFVGFHRLVVHTGFDCTYDENDIALTSLRRRTWNALRVKIDEQVAGTFILEKLHLSFRERFQYDERRASRLIRFNDNTDDAFKKARDQVHHSTTHLLLLHRKRLCTETPSPQGTRPHPTLCQDRAAGLGAAVHVACSVRRLTLVRRGL